MSAPVDFTACRVFGGYNGGFAADAIFSGRTSSGRVQERGSMKKVHRVLSGVLVLLALAAAAGAQVSSSVLQGVVTDAQGGVLPGVTVVITNVDTGLTREVSSDAAGFFRATALPPGPYTIQVRLDGFG